MGEEERVGEVVGVVLWLLNGDYLFLDLFFLCEQLIPGYWKDLKLLSSSINSFCSFQQLYWDIIYTLQILIFEVYNPMIVSIFTELYKYH